MICSPMTKKPTDGDIEFDADDRVRRPKPINPHADRKAFSLMGDPSGGEYWRQMVGKMDQDSAAEFADAAAAREKTKAEAAAKAAETPAMNAQQAIIAAHEKALQPDEELARRIELMKQAMDADPHSLWADDAKSPPSDPPRRGG